MVSVAHLRYENATVFIRALQNIPKITTPGLQLNETPRDSELETYYWLARILVAEGLAEYIEEPMPSNEWTQVHFKERINPASPPGPLPDDFYARAFQSFMNSSGDEEKESVMNRIRARFREILDSRIGRITRMAVSTADSPTSPLQREEIILYEEVHRIVSDWREKMRSIGGE